MRAGWLDANVQSNTAKGVQVRRASILSVCKGTRNTHAELQLSNIASAPTSWSWTYKTQSDGIRADVS